ncbi:hypothetical protein EYC80_000322 [Monilinia laxa]|uniref:Uncharacterized protein n=1 Tax=Monilinia laxa TaxID=61186 RepID=A0A5N6KA76_MONLA|nr:hypothetical protein EYC80_000322 [Monilinia laxa]
MEGYSLDNIFTFPTPHEDGSSHDLRRISEVEEIMMDLKARGQFRLTDVFMLGKYPSSLYLEVIFDRKSHGTTPDENVGFSALISIVAMCIMH